MALLQPFEINGRRYYADGNGTHYVSVTSAIAYISELLGQDEWAGVPPSVLAIHSMEGVGCHQACLDWLAFAHGLYARFDLPPKPPHHPDEARWKNVIANALHGFQEWCDRRKPVPLCIEQASLSKRHGLAGCPDFKSLVTLTERKLVSVKAIIELKFTAQLVAAHRIQIRSYRWLEGYGECRLGVLVRIDRASGNVEEQLILWDEEPHHDAAMLHAVGLLQYQRQLGK